MMTMRRSSWWGRHYVVTIGLLPVLAYPVLWFLLLVHDGGFGAQDFCYWSLNGTDAQDYVFVGAVKTIVLLPSM